MGCSPSGLARTAVQKAVKAVEDQLNVAEKQLDDQLNGAIKTAYDDPLDKAITGVEGQVETQTKTIVTPMKGAMGEAVSAVKDPVDGVIKPFQAKCKFPTQQIKDAASKPLDVVHGEVATQKNNLKTQITNQAKTLGGKLASDANFKKCLEADGSIGFKAKNEIETQIEKVVDPAMAPAIQAVNAGCGKAKEGVAAALGPVKKPIDDVDTEVRGALEQVEAPVNNVKAEANNKLADLMGSIAGMVKTPVEAVAGAAKAPADKAFGAAEGAFKTAVDKASEGGNKSISSIPAIPAEVKAIGIEQLNYVVGKSRARGTNIVAKKRNLLNGKLNNTTATVDAAVTRVSKVPNRAMADVFKDVTKPLDDVKAPVTQPIEEANKLVIDTNAFVDAELEKCKAEIVDFRPELVNIGVDAVIESLVAAGFKK